MVKQMARIALALATVAPVVADHWAVIVAGSNSYANYRHQADACHAYQLVTAKGIPASNIITMIYDDVANNRENPFPGKLFNKPDPNGPGKDVYEGCNIDYKGSQVTPQNYLDVLTGKASGKKLRSTAEDNVFLYFADHGAAGLIAFPNGMLHKSDLQSALQTMSDNKMFKQLVFYLEACESGSMFQGMNIPNLHAVSASSPSQSSYGAYCGSEAKINGKSIGSCLGDLFSISWMEDSDAVDTTTETLQGQYQTVKKRTTMSQVMQWGDTSFTSETVSKFQGDQEADVQEQTGTPQNVVSARMVDLERVYFEYTHATTSAERIAAGEAVEKELSSQMAVEKAYVRFVQMVYPGDEGKQQERMTARELPNQPECEMMVHDVFFDHGSDQFNANDGFALQFHQYVVNVCADQAGSNVDLAALAERAIDNSQVVL